MSYEETPIRSWPVLAAAAVFLVLLYFGISYPQHARNKARTEYNREVLSSDTLTPSVSNLMGNYFVLMTENGEEARYQGTILEDALGQLILRVYDEYEPRTFRLDISGRSVMSDEFGAGVMTYKKNIDKTTITFFKENSTCILTK